MADGYTETYDANETADVITDLLVGMGAEAFNFVSILGLLVTLGIGAAILRWALGKRKI